MAELTPQGLVIDSFETIRNRIEQDIRANVTSARSFTFTDSSNFGQTGLIFVKELASVQQLVAAVHSASKIEAEEQNLDDVGLLRGVTRRQASRSNTTRQLVVSSSGETINPSNTVFSNPTTGDEFLPTTTTTFTTNSCTGVVFNVSSVIDETEYQININDSVYLYTSGIGATALEIATGIMTAINDDLNATWTAEIIEGNLLRIYSDTTEKLRIVVITFFQSVRVEDEVSISARVVGDIVAPVNTITEILEGPPGLISTTNLQQLVRGNSREKDEDYRNRIISTTSVDCTGTVPSILGTLPNTVDGLSSIDIVENVEEFPDIDGRPPHSYEVIAIGGTDQRLVDEIYRTKPAGIPTVGNTMGITFDRNNNPRIAYFTRPIAVNFAVDVTYTIYEEEVFLPSTNTLIINAVVDYVSSLEAGTDLIPRRIEDAIGRNITGLDDITVQIQVISSPGTAPIPGNYTTSRVPITASQFANVAANDITVALAP